MAIHDFSSNLDQLKIVKYIIYALWFFTASLGYGQEDRVEAPEPIAEGNSLGILEGEPSAMVERCVNVLTGEYVDLQTDIMVSGSDELSLKRFYCSSQTNSSHPFRAWRFNHDISIRTYKTKYHTMPVLHDAFGSKIAFKGRNPFIINPEIFDKRITNTASYKKSGKIHLKNKSIHLTKEGQYYLKDGAGGSVVFKEGPHRDQTYVDRAIRPNFNYLKYFYEHGELRSVASFNQIGESFGQIFLNPTKEGDKVTLEACGEGQQKAIYKISRKEGLPKKKWIVESVERNFAPSESYIYDGLFDKILRKNLPAKRFLEIDYYDSSPGVSHYKKLPEGGFPGRVKCLKAPLGKDETPIILCLFKYFSKDKRDSYKLNQYVEGWTEVYGPYNHLTKYYYGKDERLETVERFRGTKSHQLYSQEKFFWGEPDTLDAGNLISKVISTAKGKNIYGKTYRYDEAGNVLGEFLYGNLTGENISPLVIDSAGIPQKNGCEFSYIGHTYTQDGCNSLLYENHARHEHDTLYEYHPGTTLLRARFTIDGQSIKIREFFDYDKSGVKILEMIDNGSSLDRENLSDVTERRIRRTENTHAFPLGLPEKIEEKYLDLSTGEEVLLKKTVNVYNAAGRLAQKAVFNGRGDLAYSLTWMYNTAGQVIQEINELGQTFDRDYDENGNLTREKGPSEDVHYEYTYDLMNRLIREDEISPEGSCLSKSYRYDYKGNKVASVDIYGNETRFEYDEFNREIKTIYPPVIFENELISPILEKKYDTLGNVISVSDATSLTSARYTVYGKPFVINYPDGTKEKFVYTLKGNLRKKIHKNGSYTVYQYDYLSRPIKEELYSKENTLLNTLERRYDAFHLLEEIDNAGYKTCYFYDGAGRLILKEKEGFCEKYTYDLLGRLSEKKEFYGSGAEDYVLSRKEYDVLDRVTSEWMEDAQGNIFEKTSYTYDAAGRLVKILKGNSPSLKSYNFHGDLIQEVDALGNMTKIHYSYPYKNVVETLDPLGRTTKITYDALGRSVTEETVNPLGETLRKVENGYDLKGNKTSAAEGPKKILWEYDALNRPISCLEAAHTPFQKKTCFEYDASGNLKKCIRNDGTELIYHYDEKNRLKNYFSSDTSFHYTYEYDLRDNWIRTHDLVHHQVTEREYDALNHLKKEKLGNGLTCLYDHDLVGRLVEFTLPDRSSIKYVYQGPCLAQILRHSETGEVRYQHTYDAYTPYRKPLKSTLIGQAGHLEHMYDLLDRLIQTDAPFYQENVSYDPVGNMARRFSESFDYAYTYTDLDQLKSESGPIPHAFTYDSLNNQNSKDGKSFSINLLNQLTKDTENHFSYDLRGNRLSKGSTFYEYDAQDRLLSFTTPDQKVTYTYDAENRRLSKSIFTKKDSKWSLAKTQRFLYQYKTEIGAFDPHLLELKVINPQEGSSIALELENQVYAPLHDSLGNITHLLSAKDGTLQEFAFYTSFGEETTASLNPWRYASKRLDPESGLLYFGHRYYDPFTSRWLTPDPTGFIDGLNLYTYCKNNPLRYHDPDGRFVIAIPFLVWGAEGIALALPALIEAAEVLCAAAVLYTAYEAHDWIIANTENQSAEVDDEKKKKNTNPFDGPVDGEVFVGDTEGNIIPVPTGYQLGGSRDGKCIQQKDRDGKATGIRKDGKGHPLSPVHQDPRSQNPHGHVPGVVNPDGTPWLSIY